MKNTFADYGIEVRGEGEIDTTCPECSPHRKKKSARCLSVNTEKGTWCCHHCGWSGALWEVDIKPKEYNKPQPLPESHLPEKVLAWFKSRGIGEAVLQRNRIGYGEAWIPQIEAKGNCIQFPYYRGEELINVKYRDGRKNFRMEAGAERILYGLNDIAETTIIVEGEMDKLSMEQAGFKNCVSVPDGAPAVNSKNYSGKFTFLDSDRDTVESVQTWIIASDNDEPGQKLEDELARRLGREKCKRVIWPKGCKDANEVLVNHGEQVLRECVENAQDYPVRGIFEVKSLSDKIRQLYEKGFQRGHSTGWPSLDQYYTVREGEVDVVTGIPNHGKSNWLDSLCVNLAKSQGWVFAIFSPESLPLQNHMARLMEKYSGFPFDVGPNERMTLDQVKSAEQWLDDHFNWILPEEDDAWSVQSILDLAKVLVFRKGIRGLVIDPWNWLDHSRPDSKSETEHISDCLTKIKRFAQEHGVHVWVVAHPRIMQKDKNGDYPVPTPYDISGSAHWRNKCDNCLATWRDLGDPSTQTVEIHIQKIKFREIGKVGKCELAYNRIVGTYHEPSRAVDEIPPSYGYTG